MPIKDVIVAQLGELQQTTQHNVRNLRFDQACVLFGIAFSYELDLTSIDVNVRSNSLTISDETNLLHIEWIPADPFKIFIEAYLDIFDCETDEEIAHNKTDLSPNEEAEILSHLKGWGLLPRFRPDSVVQG